MLWRYLNVLLPLCTAAFLDAADSSYFNGVFRALEVDMHLGMSQLSTMQLTGSLAAMIFGPLWAVAADRSVLSTASLLVASSAGWGLASLGIGLTAFTFPQLLAGRFINVVFLCSGMPIAQAMIATVVPAHLRGQGFALVAVAGSLGVIVASQLSTAISEMQLWGMAGWRVGLGVLGVVSLAFSLFVYAVLPPEASKPSPPAGRPGQGQGQGQGWWQTPFANLRDHWRIQSFRVLCLQGCFGTFAYQVMHFSTLWFQYCGLSNWEAGSVAALQHAGGLLGALVGGTLADALARRDPLHGRQYVAQCSVACAVPVLLLVFGALPRSPASYRSFCALMFLFGFSLGMCVPGVNRPLLSEVAPKNQLASIMAWETTFEQVFSMTLGPTLVAGLSTWYGYRSSELRIEQMLPADRQQNVDALAQTIKVLAGLAYCCVVAGYTLLHWTYEGDLVMLRAQQREVDGEGERQRHKAILHSQAARTITSASGAAGRRTIGTFII